MALLATLIAFVACEPPPDPNVPQVADDTLNIVALASRISSGPADFDVAEFIKLRGSWESFSSYVGEVSAYDDTLGKLYAAIAPLGQFTTKTVKLDFAGVTGRNIADSSLDAANSRGYKNTLAAVRLPADMVRIGDYAFAGCAKLERIVFLGSAPPLVGSKALDGIGKDGVTLVVPKGAESAFESLKAAIQSGNAGIAVSLVTGEE
jgi:hypothetical protein